MGYTRNKRRANNFRKSRQLQIKKKATRRQYKGGARQTKKRGQKGGAKEDFNAADMERLKQIALQNQTMGKYLNQVFPQDSTGRDETMGSLINKVIAENYVTSVDNIHTTIEALRSEINTDKVFDKKVKSLGDNLEEQKEKVKQRIFTAMANPSDIPVS